MAQYLLCEVYAANLAGSVPTLPLWQAHITIGVTMGLLLVELHALHDSNNLWILHHTLPHIPVAEVDPTIVGESAVLVTIPHEIVHVTIPLLFCF